MIREHYKCDNIDGDITLPSHFIETARHVGRSLVNVEYYQFHRQLELVEKSRANPGKFDDFALGMSR